jgi:hypothetical protein
MDYPIKITIAIFHMILYVILILQSFSLGELHKKIDSLMEYIDNNTKDDNDDKSA